jgi:hypothetical protein
LFTHYFSISIAGAATILLQILLTLKFMRTGDEVQVNSISKQCITAVVYKLRFTNSSEVGEMFTGFARKKL